MVLEAKEMSRMLRTSDLGGAQYRSLTPQSFDCYYTFRSRFSQVDSEV